ncbi:MAG TPA: tRNA (adenosine(37)-N6)-threonylcarbamoyltransferase complex ATPase subunit type 1 TsaE [Chitinophagales bacterium]|nr:tRNA (adenosine(37)-N6)-threonylcarbamoyltransferase complex ATPase subunit type 1 TsaE [Chitinophagales bacterium]
MTTPMRFEVNTIDDLDAVSMQITELTASYSIFCFYGEVGAGKTTLIKKICSQLDVIDTISSPTYPIINEYATRNNTTINHIDLYRLSTIDEALQIGIEEYLDNGNLCFIEWAEKIEPLLPEKYLKISILALDENRRELTFKKIQ